MSIVLTILHVIVCVILILVVLAQQGTGQDLASAFGGGGSSAAFGARGAATFLAKLTTGAAIIFMLTSLGLSFLRPAIGGGSVVPPDEPPAETVPSGVGPEETPPIEGMEPPEESGTESTTPAESQSGTEGAAQPESPPEGAAQQGQGESTAQPATTPEQP